MANEMTAHATLTGLTELTNKLSRLSEAVAADALAKSATAGGLIIENAAKVNAPRKTRTLSRSIHTEVVESDREHATVQIGTDLEYAAIQEFGGTITPKNAKYLTIPKTDLAASYGVRDFPGKLHKQGKALVDEDGIVQYALASSVHIPAQPYLRPALAEHQADAIEAAGAVLKQLIDQVSS